LRKGLQAVEVGVGAVRETGSLDSRAWSDASGYLRRYSITPRWAGSNCSGGFIRVEPLSVDQTKTLSNAGTLTSSYTVTVLPGTHFSCGCG